MSGSGSHFDPSPKRSSLCPENRGEGLGCLSNKYEKNSAQPGMFYVSGEKMDNISATELTIFNFFRN